MKPYLRPLLQTLALAIGVELGTVIAHAQPASYDAQLQAIRSALLQAAAGSPTRVLSTAWVDKNGALREAAHYQSEAHVRGVRVLNYLRDENAPPEVSAEVLPWSLRAVRDVTQKCEAPPKPWRLPLQLRVSRAPGFSGPQEFVSTALLDSVANVWIDRMQQSTRWRGLEPREVPNRAYERALFGPADEYRGWMVDLRLHPYTADTATAPTDNALDVHRRATNWFWTVSMKLRHTDSALDSAALPTMTVPVSIPISKATIAHTTLWWHAVQAQLQGVMLAWVQLLDAHLRCEPTQFVVDRTNAQTVVLRAGRGTGLQPGDRVLIMDRNQVPSHLLESGASAPLMLAEVRSVGMLTSELQILAGPPLGSQGNWVALPW